MPFRRAPNCATAPCRPACGRRQVYRFSSGSVKLCRSPAQQRCCPNENGSTAFQPGPVDCVRSGDLLGSGLCVCPVAVGGFGGGCSLGLATRLTGGLRHSAVLLLTADVGLQAGGPAAQFTQVVKLGPAGTAPAHDLDLADQRCDEREDAFDTLA